MTAIPKTAWDDPVEALKVVYRKHVLNDPDIGWDELNRLVSTCLIRNLGEEDAVRFLETDGEEFASD